MESRRIDLSVLDAMMSKFDGSDAQDVTKWLADLENAFAVFRYSERDQLVAARHLLTGHAKRFIEIASLRTYGELKWQLLGEFKRAFTVQDVFNQLRARTLKPNETPRQYVVEMQYIASRADVSDADLIDFVIDGLNDKSPAVAVLYGATSIRDLKILMERYEKRRRTPVPVPQKTSAVPIKPRFGPPAASSVLVPVPVQQTPVQYAVLIVLSMAITRAHAPSQSARQTLVSCAPKLATPAIIAQNANGCPMMPQSPPP